MVKYPTFKVKGSSTPNTKLMVCEICHKAEWSTHSTERQSYCCAARMREAIREEYIEGRAVLTESCCVNNQHIAQTIINQINVGDRWCLAAVGARDYVALDANENQRGGIMFRVTINSRLFHKIIIELTHSDEYKVVLWGGKRQCVAGEEIESRLTWCDTLAKTVYDLCKE